MREQLSRRAFISGSMAALAGTSALFGAPAPAHIPVPGTGSRIAGLGDDFEDEAWSYDYANPKSSWNIDKKTRLPGGITSNRRWAEAAMRGQPDLVKRIEPPAGGIEGSQGAMLLQSIQSGVPGRPTYEVHQDDFLHNAASVIKDGQMPISWTPNIITRVYLPAFTQWEKRTGNSFGFRVGMRATQKKEKEGKLDYEEYWPGMFVWFNYNRGRQGGVDSAQLMLRANQYGHDMRGPTLEEKTWYTLGMSFTPDGNVHYFCHSGVADLTREDYIVSYNPYGYRPRTFETFFYNTVCRDDGKTWSTPWVIDDTWLCLSNPPAKQAMSKSTFLR
jgi:hypothetical protein